MELTIKNDDLSLTIDLHGAEALHLISSNGIDYLRTRDHFWDRTAPILWPIVGRLKDGYTYISNKKYELSIHGFLRDQEFEVLKQDESSISLVNTYSKETLKHYPFKYKAIITYKLIKNECVTEFAIYNEDEQDMYFNIGGHPGFRIPLYEGEKFDDYKIVFSNKETFTSPTVTKDGLLDFSKPDMTFSDIEEIKLDYKYFNVDAIIIPRPKSKEIKILNRNNKGIKFTYEDYKTLAIWTKVGAPFICLEPWNGYGDRHDSNHQFLEKDALICLKPLKKYKATYKTTILE